MKKYCVEVKREIEEKYVFHFDWYYSFEPTIHQVRQMVYEEDIGYDGEYESFNYYKV